MTTETPTPNPLNVAIEANKAAGFTPRTVPAQGRSVPGSAVLLLVAIAIVGGVAWWAIPRVCALVGGISESSKMGLWLCAAAVLHAVCGRKK